MQASFESKLLSSNEFVVTPGDDLGLNVNARSPAHTKSPILVTILVNSGFLLSTQKVHRVQTTFIVKPPVFRIDQPGTLAAQAIVAAAPAIAARHARRGKRAAEARAAQAAV